MKEKLTTQNSESGDSELLESAKLRLALLKENFGYQEFFENLNKDPYSTCLQLKKPGEKNREYFVRKLTLIRKRARFESSNDRDLEGVCWFISIATKDFPISDILALLNPKGELDQVPDSLINFLPQLFHKPGILELPRADRLVMFGLEEKGYSSLRPHQKLLLIDLRKRKTELKKEFEHFVDKEMESHKAALLLKKERPRDWKKIIRFGYDLWKPDNSRQRKETWEHLRVWKLRKEKKGYPQIASVIGLTEDNAKKSFYRAYELTQGKKYDREYYKIKAWRIKKDDLRRTCATCPDHDTCTDPCPDVLLYIDQDDASLKEKLLKDESDSCIDALSQRADGTRHILPKKSIF